ncbi:MAG: hypothetical protein JWP88_1445, partial [Flaviaesturariibacter sp.]|nr:hypothetical protein [Flaviaesturariibacter sp.]
TTSGFEPETPSYENDVLAIIQGRNS